MILVKTIFWNVSTNRKIYKQAQNNYWKILTRRSLLNYGEVFKS